MNAIETGQLTNPHPEKMAGRFWLMAGAALLTWQINNQVVQADTTIVPTTNTTVNIDTSKSSTEMQTKEQKVTVQSGTSAEKVTPGSGDIDTSHTEKSQQPAPETAPDANSVVESGGPESQQSASETPVYQPSSGEPVAPTETIPAQSTVPPKKVKAAAPAPTQAASGAGRSARVARPMLKTVAPVNEHTSGMLGTSAWTIGPGDSNQQKVLHIGAGTLANTDVKTDADGKVIDWGALGWNNYEIDGQHPSLTLSLDGDITTGADASYLFSGLNYMNSDLKKVHTENTTNMAGMFAGATSTEGRDANNVDVIGFDTSKVTNMSHMFDGYRFNGTFDLSSFDTSQVQDMSYMFTRLSDTPSLNLKNFDTSQVTNMSHMFASDGSLGSLDLSGFNTSKVTSMASMFDIEPDLLSLNISNFDTSSVTDMSRMFEGTSLSGLDISSFNTSQVTNMSYMFADIGYDKFIKPIKGLTNLDTSKVTDMSGMFYRINLPVSAQLDLSHFNTSAVTDMSSMFKNAKHFVDDYIAKFDTSHVTNMQSMFEGISRDATDPGGELTTLKFANLDTSSVVNMSRMFANITQLTDLDLSKLSNFETHDVDDMSYMFWGDTALTSLKLANFDTRNVTDMQYMFSGDATLADLKLTNFDTRNVTNMTGMFVNDGALQNLDISSFDMRDLVLDYQPLGTLNIKNYSLLNLPAMYTEGFQYLNTNPRVLVLGAHTRLNFDYPVEKASDIIELPSGSEGSISLEDVAQVVGYSSINELKQLFSANLQPAANRSTGLWINVDTGERLTAPALMERYSGDQATAGTWTWQSVVGKDVQIIASPKAKWSPADNYDGELSVDEAGNKLALDKLTVIVRDAKTNAIIPVADVDPTKVGSYTVTYSYLGKDNVNQTSGPVKLEIVATQNMINAHDSVVQLNEPWPADNFDTAFNADGSPVTNITTKGTVNSQVPGVYTITYQFVDQFGVPVTKDVHVIVNGLTLKQTTGNFSTDDRWDPLTNVVTAIDDHGHEVAPSSLSLQMTDTTGRAVTSLKRPGSYQLIYSFKDGHGDHTQMALVTILTGENHADLQLKADEVTLYEHDTWNPMSNVQNLVDSDSEQINVTEWPQYLKVDSQVNVAQPGEYQVTYQFTDTFGIVHEKTAVVTVKPSQAQLTLTHETVLLYVGSKWSPIDNLAAVKDVDGRDVTADRVTISNPVDLTQPGHYLVVYRFTDSQNSLHTATSVVQVLANLAKLTVKQPVIHLTVGDQWVALSNLDQATDVDGTDVVPEKIQINNPVELTTPGSYTVTYQFTDQLGVAHKATVQVMIEAASVVIPGGNGNQPTTDDNGNHGTNEAPGTQPVNKLPATKPIVQPQRPAQKPIPKQQSVKQDQKVVKTGSESMAGAMMLASSSKSNRSTVAQPQLQLVKITQSQEDGLAATAKLPQTDDVVTQSTSIWGWVLLALAGIMRPWLISKKNKS
ncbi:BspA family leucine-rich repeat surface protein [Lactiplantibacillus songbeiensis]|uniref:BspA family leucine-rich repeat surface protein n=1 Tax=Lactiplantibacillus songbeiensis TaxID=2559920 RepID=A0ABW4BYC9_9LACO|nr:BspA family leucine-rich repeat surface protein [Lactiplantibacillus songbeiensis]